MKVLLLKDVYKLGHAGDVKKVADGFGRNYLIPKNLAVLATAGAMTTIDKIKAKAAVTRAALNQEMSGLAEQLQGVELSFTTKAGETGKLYGSITSQMITDALNAKLGTQIERHQIESEPIRNLGEHQAIIRLTMDLNPKVKVIVLREGESSVTDAPKSKAKEGKSAKAEVEESVEAVVEESVAVVNEPVVDESVEAVSEPVVEEPTAEANSETPAE